MHLKGEECTSAGATTTQTKKWTVTGAELRTTVIRKRRYIRIEGKQMKDKKGRLYRDLWT